MPTAQRRSFPADRHRLAPIAQSQLTGDLSPLANLTALQTLDLCYCRGFRRFAPVESLLPTLKELYLYDCKFEDLPSEVCGGWHENVLNKVRAHYEDLKPSRRIDAEVKVLFLGNGGVGKTQLCRRLRGEPFDEKNVSTHGIELRDTAIALEGFDSPVRLNLWDFGGQEIYTVPMRSSFKVKPSSSFSGPLRLKQAQIPEAD